LETKADEVNRVNQGDRDALKSRCRTWVAQTVVLLCMVALGGVFWVLPVIAAGPDTTAGDSVQQIIDVQGKLVNVAQRIERESVLAEQGSASERVARRQNVTRLREIEFIYQRQLNALKMNTTLAAEIASLKQRMANGRAYILKEKKPYSLGYYDSLLDAVTAVRQEKDALESSLKAANRDLDQKGKDLDAAEQAWRRVREEVETREGSAAENNFRYIQAQLDREASKASFELQEFNCSTIKAQMRLDDLKQDIATQKLNAIRKDASFDPAALKQEITRINKRKIRLNHRIQPIIDAQKRVERAWQQDSATANSTVTDSAMQALKTWQETYEKTLQQTEDMTQLLNTQEKLWKFRYALLKEDVSQNDLDLWEKETTAIKDQVRQAIALYQTRQVELQSRIDSLEKEMEIQGPSVKKYSAYQLDALRKAQESGDGYLSVVLATRQLSNRLLNEIATHAQKVSLWERILATGSTFKNFWNFELWVIDDNGVTVRKVVTALIILILGILLVKRAVWLLSGRLKKRNLKMSSAAAAEKLLLYMGFLLVVLFALRTVNIPLTAFTFLGGAIAIGVGFGAQNLINNFISGFIIMAERPIRIGDLIELEGKCARVEEIGARCTRIKTGENIHILVPNSSFLEKNIINWTLSDKMIRARVVVGVAYGSPVETVTAMLLEAVQKNDSILNTPEPFVIFDDFGDNALVFEIYFWIIVRGLMEKKRIASDLRYQIIALFNKNNIVIAFPQRDIHVDSLGPVQVQLLEPAEAESATR